MCLTWSWAGVGFVTLSFLSAAGPCQWPRYTVPKEPDPILTPARISSWGISQSSIDSLPPEFGRIFLDDSSAERALGLHCWRILVGEPPADCVLVGDEEGDEPWYPDVELVAIVPEECGGAKLLNAPFGQKLTQINGYRNESKIYKRLQQKYRK